MNDLKISIRIFVWLTVLTGVLYPLLVTGIAQVTMHKQASGSLIVRDGKVVGSELIGQLFSGPAYFWSRPSATGELPYDASSSSGSNLGPTNPALKSAIKARVEALRKMDPGNSGPVPTDLATSSASGLDPEISVAAAEYQVDRVARARRVSPAVVRGMVQKHTLGRQFGFLGEVRVRVLELNLELDRSTPLDRWKR